MSIFVEDIFGNCYGHFVQDGPILFEILEINKSNTFYFEIQNHGTWNINLMIMLSEDPENVNNMLDVDSPIAAIVFPLFISGFLLVLGIVIAVIRIILTLIDWKNNQNNKRSY